MVSPSDLAGSATSPVQRAEGGTRTEVTAPEGTLRTRIDKQASTYPLNLNVLRTSYFVLRPPRMGRDNDLPEMLGAHLRVHLSGGDAGVSEYFLNGS